MTIKVKTEQLGIKGPIEVKATAGLVDEANLVLIKLLGDDVKMPAEKELSDDEFNALSDDEKEEYTAQKNKEVVNLAKLEHDTMQAMFDFIQGSLKLTDKQIKKVKYGLTQAEIGEYLGYLIGRIKGQSDEDLELEKTVEERKREEEKDPKKD